MEKTEIKELFKSVAVLLLKIMAVAILHFVIGLTFYIITPILPFNDYYGFFETILPFLLAILGYTFIFRKHFQPLSFLKVATYSFLILILTLISEIPVIVGIMIYGYGL